MAKLTLNDIASTESSSIVAAFNANNDLIEQALENTLSRDGSAPNTMGANLDMNGYRVINLPDPILDGEAVNFGFLSDLVGTLNEEKLDEAIDAAAAALIYRNDAAIFRDEAENFRDEAADFVGAATSAQKLSTARTFTFTGDATGVSSAWDGSTNFSVALTIPNNSIANSDLTTIATSRFKGRVTSGTGNVEDLTGTQAASILPAYGSGVTRGVVVGDGTTTTRFLREDGAFTTITVPAAPDQGTYTTTGSVQIGDMIRKWGTTTFISAGEGTGSVTFGSAFPNACVSVHLTTGNPGGHSNADAIFQIVSYDASGVNLYLQAMNSTNSRTYVCHWEAWGY